MIEPVERVLEMTSGETFEAAIARADDWLASVLDSDGGNALLLRWAKDFPGLSASPPQAVWIVGPPAHFGEIAMLEAWLGVSLPPSYRRFLTTLGQVGFLHRPHHPTYGIGAIKRITQTYRDMMEDWFEGYESSSFARDLATADQKIRGYRSWREWPNRSGVFRPDEVKGKNFVPICPGYEQDAHMLALHLAEPSGEAPIFQNYPDDGAAFFVRGETFDAWMSSMVDDLIRDATPNSASSAVRMRLSSQDDD